MKNSVRILLIVSAIFLLIRLPLLDQLFLLHDERDIAFSGYSIAQTGRDLFGHRFPLNFTGISPNNPMVAIYYSALAALALPGHSVFFARLPYVLISTLLIWLVFELVATITKNRRKAVLTSVIFCFSPWVFHITRLALDIPLAIVLLVAAALAFIKQKRFLAYLLFFLTFYCYQGFRLLIPFLLLYLEFFPWSQPAANPKSLRSKSNSRWLLWLLDGVFVLALLASPLLIDPQTTKGRFGEIVFFNPDTVKEVIFRRNTSTASSLVKKMLDNKITVSLDYMLTNLIKGQDLIYLFKDGDYSAINGNTASGQFLFVTIVLYYLGIASFGRRIGKDDLYLLGFTLIGLIPALLSRHGASFSIRAMPSGIGFAYLIASGLILTVRMVTKTKNKKWVIGLTLLIITVNLTYVGYIYFFRRPVTVGEIFNANERTLSNRLLQDKTMPLTVYHPLPQDGFLSLAFLDKNINLNRLQNAMRSTTYVDGQYRFLPCNSKLKYQLLKQAVVSERCLDIPTYNALANIHNPMVKERIPYQDYSLKTAYFFTR
ncbi:hypothetical protein M1523_02310 [Patescibacteria group bacterium]|nr:hypothetical protein [Patescibacteria group bacterium]MCL5091446.1 hypothetical protein [Patescibacteria group bacterium]